MAHEVTLIPGDWVGPETTGVVQRLIVQVGVDIDWQTFHLPDGLVSEELLASARSTRHVLMNRLAAPRKAGSLPASILIRKELGLWAQIRHVQNLPGLPARFDGVDVMVVRETSEDVYSGFEHETAPDVFESVKVTTEQACERIARFAFEKAREHGRERVTIVHKSNIMKKSDGLFLRTGQRVARDYPDIASDEVIVDALCMRLVRWPTSFDTLLCGNLFGDIVADLVAGLAGGISVGGSDNFGDSIRLFENPHGKAPDLVGTGRGNPVSNLLMGIALLHSLGEAEAADRLRAALDQALPSLRTVDCGGQDGCGEVERAVRAAL